MIRMHTYGSSKNTENFQIRFGKFFIFKTFLGACKCDLNIFAEFPNQLKLDDCYHRRMCKCDQNMVFRISELVINGCLLSQTYVLMRYIFAEFLSQLKHGTALIIFQFLIFETFSTACYRICKCDLNIFAEFPNKFF